MITNFRWLDSTMVFGGFLICKLGQGMLRLGWFWSQFLHRFGWAQQISAYIAVTGDWAWSCTKPFVKADWFGSCLFGLFGSCINYAISGIFHLENRRENHVKSTQHVRWKVHYVYFVVVKLNMIEASHSYRYMCIYIYVYIYMWWKSMKSVFWKRHGPF